MATKTITIMEKAYSALAREKLFGESFSGVILRLTRGRGSLSDCFGSWKITDEELGRMRESLERGWKDFEKRLKN